MYIVKFGLKTSLHVLGEHNGTKTELYRTNAKSQGFVPAHFALIIIIVVHVVKHQSVLINTCRRQESLRMMLGSSSIIRQVEASPPLFVQFAEFSLYLFIGSEASLLYSEFNLPNFRYIYLLEAKRACYIVSSICRIFAIFIYWKRSELAI